VAGFSITKLSKVYCWVCKQEDGCLVHFMCLATALLKVEESALHSFPFFDCKYVRCYYDHVWWFFSQFRADFQSQNPGIWELPVVVKSHWIRLLGCIGIQFINIRYYLQCCFVPWVLWYCWLGASKSSRSVKIEWWGADVVISLELGAGCLHMVQLMPVHPKIPSTLASFKPSLFYVCATSLPRLSWKRGC